MNNREPEVPQDNSGVKEAAAAPATPAEAAAPAPAAPTDLPIKRALISVTDKSGVAEFARTLSQEFGIQIISTGGTARTLTEAEVEVTPIEDVTGFPEMMDGRVKTLHPRVHGGLLARRDVPEHLEQAAEHGIEPIDMIVVNLYAFSATIATPGTSYETAIENIDIGGPAMIRSAAKNHDSVTVVTSPDQYDAIIDELRTNAGATTFATRQRLAYLAFGLTSTYDEAIFKWMNAQISLPEVDLTPNADDNLVFPLKLNLSLPRQATLRYGENPHQNAAFYRQVMPEGSLPEGVNRDFTLGYAAFVQGKELSYNNFLDIDAAWAAVREFDGPAAVIVKHLTPCGIAQHADIVTAYQRAHDVDPTSAYGGVMAFNRPVSAAMVQAIYANDQFVEAIIAPSVDVTAAELLSEKPSIRVLATSGLNPAGWQLDYKSVEGGLLVMQADAVETDQSAYTIASERQPTPDEYDQLLFAWKCVKSVKSNAIVIANDFCMVGAGAGQPNRVNSARIAAEQAGEAAIGAVAASDAFMPFADSMEVLITAGVKAVIQPGGSVRDDEVIAAANAAGVALVFTGARHFRH
ncbi:MAG: bifunctional phosphoribosylaminoimidazolecarboxamide formyltransferase/IMP cyclohydrolase [Coriobacteriia bacterium]|nr:bifunctional phosphoribosylaminoimidazolecarboxamide formyltransferase/IMP cyclohydrolase [Coriobacteriia bacterium]